MSIIGDIYEGGGAKPASFPSKGTTFEGTIENIRQKQLEVYGRKGVLETWPNGEPKYTPIITLQTDLEEEDGDDGRRDIYLRTGAFTAFGKALRESYRQKPSDSDLIGAAMKIRFDSEAPSSYGSPRKVFLCRITPKPSTAASDAWDSPASSGQHDNAPPPDDTDIPF